MVHAESIVQVSSRVHVIDQSVLPNRGILLHDRKIDGYLKSVSQYTNGSMHALLHTKVCSQVAPAMRILITMVTIATDYTV